MITHSDSGAKTDSEHAKTEKKVALKLDFIQQSTAKSYRE